MSVTASLRYLILVVLFLPSLVLAEELQAPLVDPLKACQSALEFNKTDYMRMRDQFVTVAIQAEALKAKLEAVQKELDVLKPKPDAQGTAPKP